MVDTGRVEGFDLIVTALVEAGVEPGRITRIILTHCHPDHVGGARELREMTGAPVYAPPLEREQIERFAPGLTVDYWLDHEAPVECEGFSLTPVFTPGHSPGHLCFVESGERMLLAGDMISGFGTVGIFPPNGSVAAYIASLRRLLALHEAEPFSAVLPGHGPVVPDAGTKIEEYIAHRLEREQQIIDALARHGPLTLDELPPLIYDEILPHLLPAGKATISMHLQKLLDEGRVAVNDERYRLS
jgi:glyoxylase-like metal-dependent hydrolase (beta-lactamase superfamily II)